VRTLVAKIGSEGDLVLEGHDLSPAVSEFWPEDEYQWWLTVPARYKNAVLLG